MALITIKPKHSALEADIKFESYPKNAIQDFDNVSLLDKYKEEWRMFKNGVIDSDPYIDDSDKFRLKKKRAPFYIMADFLIARLFLVNISETGDTGGESLFVYNPQEGIYQPAWDIVPKLVRRLEPSFRSTDINEIICALSCNCKNVSIYQGLRYIALGNCIYDTYYRYRMKYSPSIVFAHKIQTNYNLEAVSPLLGDWSFDSWLNELFNNDDELIHLAWQTIFAVVSGYADERIIWLIGKGGTGKGSFQELLINLVGGNNVASMKLIELDGRNRFATSRLIGKHLVIGDDNPIEKVVTDPSTMFSLVTHDIVTIEKKCKQPYSTRLTPVIVQSANQLIKILGDKEAIARRTLVLPFVSEFNKDGYNREIKQDFLKRQNVLEYVLMRALEYDIGDGFKDLRHHPAVREVQGMSMTSIELFSHYLFSRVKSTFLPNSFMLWAYTQFCEKNSLERGTKEAFHKGLKDVLPPNWVFKPTQSTCKGFYEGDSDYFIHSEPLNLDTTKRYKGYVLRSCS
jgi:poxvirus D5 protein-like